MELNYVDVFSNTLRELYGQSQLSVDLYNSNQDLQIVQGKNLKVPKMTVSGYKDHKRGTVGFNAGTYSNDYELKTLDHDRDIEFAIDPMDVDETNLVVSIGNIQSRFENTQAIPEADCYTFSKLYTEAKRVNAKVSNEALTKANILEQLDDDLMAFSEAGVPLDRVIMYCTPAVKKLLKTAEGIQRTLEVTGGEGIDRRVHTVDDIRKIVEVPSARLKTGYDFTNGCVPAGTAKQINYIIVDPEAQVSRQKYSYIKVFTPGHDSRTADNYIYQNRKYNGTFGIDQLLKEGIRINAEA